MFLTKILLIKSKISKIEVTIFQKNEISFFFVETNRQ